MNFGIFGKWQKIVIIFNSYLIRSILIIWKIFIHLLPTIFLPVHLLDRCPWSWDRTTSWPLRTNTSWTPCPSANCATKIFDATLWHFPEGPPWYFAGSCDGNEWRCPSNYAQRRTPKCGLTLHDLKNREKLKILKNENINFEGMF